MENNSYKRDDHRVDPIVYQTKAGAHGPRGEGLSNFDREQMQRTGLEND
jgi:hypothetical protein